MSILPRREAAPSMRVVSCSSMEEASSMMRDLDKSTDTSTLLIHPPDSPSSTQQHILFLELVDILEKRKRSFPESLLRLRELITEEPSNADSVMEIDGQSSSPGLSLASSSSKKEEFIALRRLEISNFTIGARELEAIERYVHGNSSLAVLCLKATELVPCAPTSMQCLAKAVNMSSLRVLDLSNNPIGTRSVVQLIDNLDTPCLNRLGLSMTMLKSNLREDQKLNPLWTEGDQSWANEDVDTVWRREVIQVGKSIANLLSNNGKGGYAPRLAMLLLSANDLGWRSVKRIVSAVLEGNRTLTLLELFATTTSQSASDDDDELERDTSNELTRRSSIGDLYFRRKRSKRDYPDFGNVTPPRNGSLHSSRTGLSEHQERLSSKNWRFQLGRHLWENKIHRTAVKDASRYILATARVLTCKCREGSQLNANGNIFPFTRLPPEIRRNIIGHLDNKSTLSRQQVERIISFASDPATLGYGSKSSELGLSAMALQHIHDEVNGIQQEDEQDYGLLPHRSWSWSKMIQSTSIPRDWPATLLDSGVSRASSEEDDEYPDIQGLGGGGPDGYGGITYDRIGPDPARRKWLDEQSGLQAFWDTV